MDKEYKNSPNDMETITMWAELSDSVADARRNTPPTIDVQNVITNNDVAKIQKDADIEIAEDEKKELRTYLNSSKPADVNALIPIAGVVQII